MRSEGTPPGGRLAKLLAILMLAACPRGVEAGSGPGSSFGEGLRLIGTAWSISMSDALVASAEGISALTANPAGVLGTGITTLHVTHISYIQDLKEDYLAYAQRLPFGAALGFSLHGFYDTSLTRVLEDSAGGYLGESGEFPVAFGVGGAAFAMELGGLLPGLARYKPAGGVGVRILAQQVDSETWMGLTTDLGFRMSLGRGFAAGGVLQNAGLVRGDAGLPLQWTTGIAWRRVNLARRGDAFLIETDFPLAVDRALSFKTGAEYRAVLDRIMLAVRGGWKSETDVPGSSGLTAGLGFRWLLGRMPWGLDYAYVPWGVFGQVHALSLTVGLLPRLRTYVPVVSAPPRERDRVESFYPLLGEKARYLVEVEERAEVTAHLLDEDGVFLIRLIEPVLAEAGQMEITWDGRLAPGALADFDRVYRILVQVGPETHYLDVMPRAK